MSYLSGLLLRVCNNVLYVIVYTLLCTLLDLCTLPHIPGIPRYILFHDLKYEATTLSMHSTSGRPAVAGPTGVSSLNYWIANHEIFD